MNDIRNDNDYALAEGHIFGWVWVVKRGFAVSAMTERFCAVSWEGHILDPKSFSMTHSPWPIDPSTVGHRQMGATAHPLLPKN